MQRKNLFLGSIATIALAGVVTIGITLAAGSDSGEAFDNDSGAKVASYSKGTFSTEFTITNNTGQTITLDDEHTAINLDEDDTYWGQQPQETLDDGKSETVSAYTHKVGGLDMAITYDLPNGGYAYFEVGNDLVGNNNTRQGVYGAFLDNAFNAPDTSTVNHAYEGTGSAKHGVHITAKAEIHQS